MRKPNQPDAYTLNTRTGNMQLIAQNTGNITQWHADHSGKIRLATAQTDHNTHLLSRTTDQQAFVPIIDFCPTDQLKPIGFDADNQEFFALSNISRDKIALVKINPNTGNETQIIYQNPTADVYTCSYSTTQQRIASVAVVQAQLQNQALTISTQNIYNNIAQLLPKNQQFVVVSSDANEKTFIIKTNDGGNVANYFLYKNNALLLLYNANQDLNLPKMCAVLPVSIPSCDGLQMQSYITLPHKKTKNLPFVVLIHRFSDGRATLKYDAAAQYFASRGYGVLMINFRGATGYGKYYHNLAKKELGKKIDCDIQDGVSWLVQQRYADPKKIAVVGENFGGFCAYNCAAQCPETFACAAGYSSTLNLANYMQHVQKQPIATQSRLIESIGHPQDDSLLLLQRSPLYKASSIQSPILIYQNTRQPAVNQHETRQMIDILRKNNVPVVYRISDNKNAQEEIIRFYQDTEIFLHNYLK
jgi:dipeptidyl aminopeptidase/acylaminoacyl peptidase